MPKLFHSTSVVVALSSLCVAASASLESSSACARAFGGSSDLDLDRWRVGSRPEMREARREARFGSYRFNVSDGFETFVLNFGMVEGVPWPQPIAEELYAQAHKEVRLRRGDVVVATYPKSGTTWTEQIVLLLLHGSHSASKLRPDARNTYSARTNFGKHWLEPTLAGAGKLRPDVAAPSGARPSGASSSMTAASFAALPSPRVIKSHAPFEMLLGVPRGLPGTSALDASGAKVLYVARNAKDAAVSLYFQRAPLGRPFSGRGRRQQPDSSSRKMRRREEAQQENDAEDLSARAMVAHHLARRGRRPRVTPEQDNLGEDQDGGLARNAQGRRRRRRQSSSSSFSSSSRRTLLAALARRRGADVAPSDVDRYARRMPMDAWAALYLSGHMSCGSYFDHVATWHAAARASPKNIFFLKYEDLQADAMGAIRRVADFLDLDRSDDEIARVANASSLDAMKRQSSSGSSSKVASSPTPPTRGNLRASRYNIPPGTRLADVNASASTHLREGKVGSWRAYFGPRLSAQFDAVYAARMRAAVDRAESRFFPASATDGARQTTADLHRPRFDFGCGVVD